MSGTGERRVAGRLDVLTGAAAVVLLLAAAWLLVPSVPSTDHPAPAVRVLLVDASASIVRTRPGWLPWVRDVLAAEATDARDCGQALAVVSFAAEVARSFPAGPPGDFLDRLAGRDGAPFDPRSGAGPDDETRLAAALEVAAQLALAAGRPPGEVVVIGTEATTGREPWRALARLAAGGVLLRQIAAPAPELLDLALLRLDLPGRVEAGSPLTASVRGSFTPGAVATVEAWLEVEVETAGGQVRSHRVALDHARLSGSGDGAWELPLRLGQAAFGRTEVRVRGVLRPGPDPVPENDLVQASTVAEGELVIGVVADADRLDAARRWLAPAGSSGLAGIQLVFDTRAGLPHLLADLDALITFDLSPERLPALLLERFVAEGGGWLATGGWRFLERWSPSGGDQGLRRLLPMVPAPADQEPRDVVLLVDGSGSMEGEAFDTVRTAALDLVAAALPSDDVSLAFFTMRLEEAHAVKPRLGPEEGTGEVVPRLAEDAARRLLALRVPHGQTHLLRSLEEFAAQRRDDDEEALALLLTDGLEREAMPDPAGRAALLLETLAAARVRLVVLAIGERADLGFLELLTTEGEEVLRPRGLEELRAIFRREISGARWYAGESLSVRWSPSPPGARASLARTIAGPSPAPIPAVRRIVRNALRPTAVSLWEADASVPVLALQRVDAGRCALLGTIALPGWAPSWSGRPGLGQPAELAGLLRWLGRGLDRRASEVRVVRTPGTLEVRGLGPGWPATLAARLVDVSGPGAVELATLSLRLPSRGPRPSERRAALLGPTLERRLRQGEIVLDLGGAGAPRLLPLPALLAEEFGRGGRALSSTAPGPSLTAPARGQKLPERGHPAGPWLLGLGLGLLFGASLAGSSGQGILPSDR